MATLRQPPPPPRVDSASPPPYSPPRPTADAGLLARNSSRRASVPYALAPAPQPTRRASTSTIPSHPYSTAPTVTNDTFRLPPSLEHSADVIVRSSDGGDFPVHRARLAAESTFFRQLFEDELQSPGSARVSEQDEWGGWHQADVAELDIIQLSENGQTVRAVLSWVYFGMPYQPLSLNRLHRTLMAAYKWHIASMQDSLIPFLAEPQFFNENPLAAYGLSRFFEFEEGQATALEVLFAMEDHALAALEMDGVRAKDLAAVHSKRLERAVAIVEALRMIIYRHYEYGRAANNNMPMCRICGMVPLWVHIWLIRVDLEAHQRPVLDRIFSLEGLEFSWRDAPVCPCSEERIWWDPMSFQRAHKMVAKVLKLLEEKPWSELKHERHLFIAH